MAAEDSLGDSGGLVEGGATGSATAVATGSGDGGSAAAASGGSAAPDPVVGKAAAADPTMGRAAPTDPEAARPSVVVPEALPPQLRAPTLMPCSPSSPPAYVRTSLPSSSPSRGCSAPKDDAISRRIASLRDRAGLSLSLSRADLATVVVAKPQLLCAKAEAITRRIASLRDRAGLSVPQTSSFLLSGGMAHLGGRDGGEGRGGGGYGCCKRRRHWWQTASIPSLPHPFNQTKKWDRPILQTKHASGIIPASKSGMVSSHPT
ncbi:hypothetical protein OsJ_28310 [Oryza sativa Japonica Group]|uniref:Uncharacterized protein n=1 Tax=Oryza sativa subsp. japonica TaxID=39947 RepID=A3BVU6_ORYSJ|nr:hypothetical protein OsJ_28310 [Oryza sativa Japonica Group]